MSAPRKTASPPLVADESFPLWLDGFAFALLVARWFMPAEGVYRGDSLWIAQLWLLWAAIAAWTVHRLEIPWKPKWNALTAGITLLIAGHLISAILVCVTQGQKRAAMNGFWEWVSLAVTVIWLGSRARAAGHHRQMVIAVLAVSTALSGFGLWQRAVIQPALSQSVLEFDALERDLPELTGSARRLALRRYQTLRDELGPDYVSLDTNGRQAMRQRLIGSTEPLGLFALTNTFAALLVVALFTGGELVAGRPLRWRSAIRIACLLLVALTLLLTKSRTAFAGAALGACAGAVLILAGSPGRGRRILWVGSAIIGLGVMLLIAATAIGGLDWKVIGEATKSLRYRGEYWQSTWGVIQEHPVAGVGPGNFRAHYLAYKLPQSSEEILDPHDLFLDVWVNGGLLSLCGAIGICLVVGFSLVAWRESAVPPSARRISQALIPLALIAGCLFVAVETWLFEGTFDSRAAILGIVAAIAAWWIDGRDESARMWRQSAVAAGWIALTVHLLGAGGIGMPAISQLWLWLAIAATTREATTVRDASTSSWRAMLMRERQLCGESFTPKLPALTAAVTLLLAATQFLTSTAPVMQSRTFIAAAETAVLRGNLPQAQHDLEVAAAADRFDPEPRRRLAQIAFANWRDTGADESMERAIRWETEAIERDPQNPHDFRLMGEMHLARFEKDRRDKDADTAEVWLRQAVARYPHHAQTQGALARAAHASGHFADAAHAAEYALKLDRENRELGHYDRLLTDDVVARLQETLAKSKASPPR